MKSEYEVIAEQTTEIQALLPAIALLRELLANSQAFISAIELDHGLDGEDWAAKARALVEEYDKRRKS